MGSVLEFNRKAKSYDKGREVKLLLARAASLLDEMGEKERRVGWLVSECAALLRDDTPVFPVATWQSQDCDDGQGIPLDPELSAVYESV